MKSSSKSEILLNAELAWRTGHCLRFWASYHADEYACAGLMDQLALLTNIFTNSSLPCHPIVCKHTQALGLISDILSIAGPSLRYQLHKYLHFNTGDAQLAQNAAIVHPNSDMHRYEFLSTKKRMLQYIMHAGSITDSVPFNRPMIFSPVMEMAIGHYAVINEYLVAQRLLGYIAPVYMVSSGYGVDCGIVDKLKREYEGFDIIRLSNADDIIEFSRMHKSTMLDCDYRIYWLSRHVQKAIMRGIRPSDRATVNRSVILHTRTSSYKADDDNIANNLRSVDPRSYLQLVMALQTRGFKVKQISTNKIDAYTKDADMLIVADPATKAKQWDLLDEAEFVVGTSSGISHFVCRAGFCALLTNYTSMPSDYLITDKQVVSLKRFKLKKSQLKIDNQSAVALLIRHWLDRTDNSVCFSDIVDISDLSANDLEANIYEYLNYISGGGMVSSFHDLLRGKVNSSFLSFVPNWLVTSTTATDIIQLLGENA